MSKNSKEVFRENYIVTILPLLLTSRVIVDGAYNFTIFGLTATYVIGIFLFLIALPFYFVTPQRSNSILILLTIFITASSIQGSNSWGNSAFDELVRTVGIIGFFLVAASSRKSHSFHRFLIHLRFISVSSAVVAVVQFILQDGGLFVSGAYRYPGLMYGSNSAALLYGTHIFTEFTFLKNSKRKIRTPAAIASSLGILLSLSLSGLIYIFVIFSTLYFLVSDQGKLSRMVKITSATVMIPYLLYSFVPTFRAKYSSSVTPVLQNNANDLSSIQWRFSAWEKFLAIWAESPILGQGFGSTRNLNMIGPFLPHNEFLRLLVEVGLIGLLIVTTMYFLILIKLRQIYKVTQDSRALYVTSILVGFAINSTSENTFTYTVPQYVVAGILGFTLSQFNSMEGNSFSQWEKIKGQRSALR